MGRILAIDFGTKRTGLAVTDPMQIIATALTTVDTHQAIAYLKNYLAQEAVDEVVIGYALNLDGTPAQSAEHINAFIKQLNKNFPQLAVHKHDERFTSKMAFQTLVDSGISRTKRRDKKLVDKVAAVLILQSYLEKRDAGK